MQSLHNFF